MQSNQCLYKLSSPEEIIMVKKTNMGRRKIEIKKLENKNTRDVTFCKRKKGLFKKASELCTLCGTEISILVFSRCGKAFTFGHPTFEAVADRFLAENPATDTNAVAVAVAGGSGVDRMQDLEREYAEVLEQLAAEKKKGKKLRELRKTTRKLEWFEQPTEELSLPELQELQTSLEDLKKKVAKLQDELFIQSSSWLSL